MNNAPPNVSPSASRLSPGGSTIKQEDEELAALGGKTRLVARKSNSQPSSPQDSVHQNTPSPKGSPGQHYTPDGIPLIPAPVVQHTNGIDTSATHWQTFQQPTGDVYYSNYPVQSGQWSPESEYGSMHSPTIPMSMGAMQYPAYESMQPMGNSYAPTHSPMETHMQVADPNASWQSLFAQFNQA